LIFLTLFLEGGHEGTSGAGSSKIRHSG